VTLFHWRPSRRVRLLAAGVLEGRERQRALAHIERCRRCRDEHRELSELVAALQSDPIRSAEPDLPLAVLVRRVEREVETTSRAPRRRPRLWLVAVPAAAAVMAVAWIVPRLAERTRRPPQAARASIPRAEAGPLVTEDALARIERNLAREHAARYLSEAGEVLVAVAASGSDCDRNEGRLDVGLAPERSRELLAKRQLVVEAGGQAVSSARGVLDDVEMALRDVAELPSCVRRRDVERVRYEVERRQLLMRIRLVTRELEG
jgi:anti-sigma factor RsiW